MGRTEGRPRSYSELCDRRSSRLGELEPPSLALFPLRSDRSSSSSDNSTRLDGELLVGLTTLETIVLLLRDPSSLLTCELSLPPLLERVCFSFPPPPFEEELIQLLPSSHSSEQAYGTWYHNVSSLFHHRFAASLKLTIPCFPSSFRPVSSSSLSALLTSLRASEWVGVGRSSSSVSSFYLPRDLKARRREAEA